MESLHDVAWMKRSEIRGPGSAVEDEDTAAGIELPAGLRQADRLPEPIYTPSTKAGTGEHDRNIAFERTVELLGRDLAERVRDISLHIYREAADYARARGILIADTKLEFGLDEAGRLTLMDEVLTPDSSRFWPADQYRPGISPPSFDKQYVRDYLETLDWDKTAPGPSLPAEVIRRTAETDPGRDLAERVRDISLHIYREAADYARARGILIADTKLEFGLDEAGRLTLMDEVLTPDSSRFWPADQYRPGISPPSFDKQYVRDYLETLDWDKTAPGPSLPAEVIRHTAEKYREAQRRLTGV